MAQTLCKNANSSLKFRANDFFLLAWISESQKVNAAKVELYP